MTEHNTKEKEAAQHRYNGNNQENRPRKKRRRRYPAEDSTPVQPEAVKTRQGAFHAEQDSGLQTEVTQNTEAQAKTEQNTAPQTGTAQDAAFQAETVQNTTVQTDTIQDTALKTETMQDTNPQTDTGKDVQLTETSQEAIVQAMDAPAAEPETTMAESIDYQAAYQEIYRDILNNLRSFSPSDQVACSITEEHIREYLNNSHEEKVLQFKERREKRFFAALELIAVLAAIVLVIHYLQNNSAILVNILYIIAGLGALFLWKFQPKNDEGKPDKGSDGEAP